MHKRTERKRKVKTDATNNAFRSLSQITNFSSFLTVSLEQIEPKKECPPVVDWSLVPAALDPSCGVVDPSRALRKREQISAMATNVLPYLKDGMTCVEFGAGAGHLGLLLAYLCPFAKFILLELREFSSVTSKKRADDLGLKNVDVFTGDIQAFGDSEQSAFDIGISLHSCGLLTDWCQRLCVRVGAIYVLCPCCYGRVSNEENATWRSQECGSVASNKDFLAIAKASDFTVKASDSDFPEKDGFRLAKKSMISIDYDRNKWACEVAPYETKITSLTPLRSSPKNNVIIGVPLQDKTNYRTKEVIEINPTATDMNPTYPNPNNALAEALPDNERRRVKREKNKNTQPIDST